MKLETTNDLHGNTVFFKKQWPESSYIIANGNGTYRAVSKGVALDAYEDIEDAVAEIEKTIKADNL